MPTWEREAWEKERPPSEALEERLRLALAAAEIGTWDFYPISGAMFWDARCRAMHGVGEGTPMSYDFFMSGVHPDDRRRVEDRIQQMLVPARGGRFVLPYRYRRHDDGMERFLTSSGSVLFDSSGRATRMIGTVQDATQQQREEQTRERLLGIVGHDLRGPLSAIRIAAAMLARPSVHRPERLVEIIRRGGERMSAMIAQLLDFTSVRLGGGLPLTPDWLDLAVLASESRARSS